MVSSEVLMASESGCPIEVHRIEIEKCDEMYDRECKGNKYIPFQRAGYDRKTGQSPNSPREQVSIISSKTIHLIYLNFYVNILFILILHYNIIY